MSNTQLVSRVHRPIRRYAVLLTLQILCFIPIAQAARPNIVLILADDLGFSDIAPYGGEINTPTLSKLADNGVRFTNYHTAASCAPSRSMLLTGVDSHRNGVPNIPEAIPPEQAQHANYQGTLGHNVVTVATLLQDGGYHTYMAGKWHLGKTKDLLPSRRGFDRTIAMADTGADNWEQKPYLPIYKKANWYADGEETTLPKDFYSSRFIVDKTIEFIGSNIDDDKPFFAYLPFQAVHIPVQAPQKFIDKYMGRYDQGWDQLRRERQQRAKDMGLVPQDSNMTTMHTTGIWDDLPAEEQRYQAKRMAVYAAMIEAMDHHIGRLVTYLQSTGQYENTIFIFTSDNGSEASGGNNVNTRLMRLALKFQDYTNDYETLGLKGSFSSIGPSFASAAAAPLAYYKFYAGEGGMRVPLLIAAPSGQVTARQVDAFSFVTDIAATVLDIAGISTPEGQYKGRPIETMIGRSLMPLTDGRQQNVYAEHESIGYELAGNAALFQGDYKIVINRAPIGDNQWHLYNIARDPGETQDLSGAMPERRQAMLKQYQRYEAENGVLPVPDGYNQRLQIAFNGVRDIYGRQIVLALLGLLTVVTAYLGYRFTRRRRS